MYGTHGKQEQERRWSHEVSCGDVRTFITYTNVIIDERHGARTVYMPVYRHVPELDAAASLAWHAAELAVHRVDCTDVYPHFGSLRCLVNVATRRRTAAGLRLVPKSPDGRRRARR